jgi:hypothetical protein
MTQASWRVLLRRRIEALGKWGLDASGKYRVNEDG